MSSSSTPKSPACPVCGNAYVAELAGPTDTHKFRCLRCGEFQITATALATLPSRGWEPALRARISSYLFENQGTAIRGADIPMLEDMRLPSVDARAWKLLQSFSRALPLIGEEASFAYDDEDALGFMAASWSETSEELDFLIHAFLEAEGLLSTSPMMRGSSVVITPLGYRRLADLDNPARDSTIGFCAMWFDPSVRDLWTMAIKPAIELAGYNAVRIDAKEHLNKIDDEIIKTIRQSRFVVADFTGQRGGVYFEAGFAQGLQIPVVWTVREDAIKDLHFDTRQYNFLTWTNNAFADFSTRLNSRIEAVIGWNNRRGMP